MSLFAAGELEYQRKVRLLVTFLYSDEPLERRKDFLASMGMKLSGLPVVGYLTKCVEELGDFPSYELLQERGLVDSPFNADGWVPNYVSALDLLDEAWRLRRALDFRTDLINLEDGFKTASEGDVIEFLSRWRDKLSETHREELDMSPQAIYERRLGSRGGIRFGIAALDTLCGGCEAGSLTVVGGYAGHGKTTVLTNMAYINAVSASSPVDSVLLTLEVPKELMVLNLVARHSRHARWEGHTPLSRFNIMKGTLSPEQRVFFNEVADDLMTNPAYGRVVILDLGDLPSVDPDSIKVTVRRSSPHCGAVFVDYVNVFKNYPIAGIRDPYERGNFYVRKFAEMALDWFGEKLPVVLAAQINRTNYRAYTEARNLGEDEGYNLSCFAELNEIEKSAYYAVTVFSDEDLMATETLKVQLLKHRGGQTLVKPVDVRIEPRYCLVGDDGKEIRLVEDDLTTLGLDAILGDDLS